MRLTRDQIERMYHAAQDSNGTTEFYAEEDEQGHVRFGTIERKVVEKRKPIPLSKVKA